MRPPNLPRGSASSLPVSWQTADNDLFRLLDGVEAGSGAHTLMVTIARQRYANDRDLRRALERYPPERGTSWTYLSAPDGEGSVTTMALPTDSRVTQEEGLRFPFVMVHTWMVAWWLCAAWRTQELARASRSLFEIGDYVASAAVARSLLETAASFWADGLKIHAAWGVAKTRSTEPPPWDSTDAWWPILAVLIPAIEGGRFRASNPSEAHLERVPPRQVLKDVDKLKKALPDELRDRFHSAYEWLCNTVHPSFGTRYVYQVPALGHASETHILTWLAGRPAHLVGSSGAVVEDTVENAIVFASAAALRILRECFDASLRMIDDVGLTTRAGEIGVWEYWRRHKKLERNAPCACRSGKKAKYCKHSWGEPPPPIPDLRSGF